MMVFLIDIDGTCCTDIKNEDSHLYPTAEVFPGSREQINKWHEEGHHITFFTARESKDRDVTIIDYQGTVLGEYEIDPNKNYQPKK